MTNKPGRTSQRTNKPKDEQDKGRTRQRTNKPGRTSQRTNKPGLTSKRTNKTKDEQAWANKPKDEQDKGRTSSGTKCFSYENSQVTKVVRITAPIECLTGYRYF